ncbi:acyl-protein thioesterase 1,2 [Cordyceps javanica]|uniref:Acyl-protein thioesterase 1,2 n=1 Tax=Cordyceps javanica TaxID=43265 RepID=A0A545V808_9HYPO|nr:acyl-protein thioesterase 1,2 [Cordyceps javanica]
MSFFFGHITPTDDPFATHSLESAGEEVDLASAASTAPPFDEGGCDLATLLGTPDFAADKRFSGAQSPITASYHQNIPGEDVFPSEPAKAGDPILSASNRNNSTQQWNTAHGIEQKFGYSSRATSQLLRLLPKIKQELSKFENGFWRNEGAASLDDYPIWNIVLMAREIREVASAIFGKSEEALRENQLNYQIGPTSHYGTKADTPAVLLLLCGHIWLMRLYSVVLDHVQNRIDDIPTVTDHSQLLDHATLWPDLLSEHRSGLLSLPDLGLGLAVKSVECQLGGDGFQLREAAVTALQNDDYVPSGNLQSIEMRFDSLKQQLRTKIGF